MAVERLVRLREEAKRSELTRDVARDSKSSKPFVKSALPVSPIALPLRERYKPRGCCPCLMTEGRRAAALPAVDLEVPAVYKAC